MPESDSAEKQSRARRLSVGAFEALGLLLTLGLAVAAVGDAVGGEAVGPSEGRFPSAESGEDREARRSAQRAGALTHEGRQVPISRATLWLARCIYSETNRPAEQELVAWVVRNRVETGFRGRATYRGVVLDEWQFSAFRPGAPHRHFYAQLPVRAGYPGWKTALLIARYVRHASPDERPFPQGVRHFYSEVSMPERRPPDWAVGRRPVLPERPYRIDPQRFRFFRGVGPAE